MSDRQSITQSLVESALRAAAAPVVTGVFRHFDYYEDGSSVQQLLPILVVSVTNDVPYGIGIGLYRASCSVTIVADWAPDVRDVFDRVRASVRSVMGSLRGLAAYGVFLSAAREISCTEPDFVNETGDVVLAQDLSFQVWFEGPTAPPAILDPVPYLIDRDPATGATYVTCQAQDPRRIDRWTPSGNTLTLAHGFGAWADRATLEYTAPVQPLSTAPPPPINSNPSASAS